MSLEMNDFPVIGDLVMRTGFWDRQGANIATRYKEMYGVELFLREKQCLWTQNAAFCRDFMRNGGDQCWCVEISSFCVMNAINSIDKHSLREVECEIYVH